MMNRNLWLVLVSVAVLLGVNAGCGSPQMESPDSLEVVFLPLAGAQNVALDVEPKVYFSGDVDASSEHTTSVVLESTALNLNSDTEKYECESTWLSVDGQPQVDESNSRAVVFSPSANFSEQTCYRLTCTTDVQGTALGPLEALPCNPEEQSSCRKNVGAEEIFWTAIP